MSGCTPLSLWAELLLRPFKKVKIAPEALPLDLHRRSCHSRVAACSTNRSPLLLADFQPPALVGSEAKTEVVSAFFRVIRRQPRAAGNCGQLVMGRRALLHREPIEDVVQLTYINQ